MLNALRRLEAQVDQLLAGQGQIVAELRQHRKDTNAGLDRIEGKISWKFPKLIWLVSPVAGALITLPLVPGVRHLLA